MLYRLTTRTLHYHAYTTKKCSIHIIFDMRLKLGLSPIILLTAVVLAWIYGPPYHTLPTHTSLLQTGTQLKDMDATTY